MKTGLTGGCQVAFSEGSAAGQQELLLPQSSPVVPDLIFQEEMEIGIFT